MTLASWGVRPVIVVGAGIAGLVAARELSSQHEVVVVDKGRGVGGRLATRRAGDASFDHGAQFITTRSEWFSSLIADTRSAGVVHEWFRGEVGPDGPSGTGHPRWCARGGMSAIAKHLAQGLDVRTSVRVTAATPIDGGWLVRTDENDVREASAVVFTAPVPQTLDILAAGGTVLSTSDASALSHIAYEPCTAVMVVLNRPLFPLPASPGGDVVAWIADNTTKGTSAAPHAITVHTTATYGEHTWHREADHVAAAVLAAIGVDPSDVEGVPQVHRWRFAKPTVLHTSDHLLLSGLPPAVVAGDAFGGASVEGAASSGRAAARALLD